MGKGGSVEGSGGKVLGSASVGNGKGRVPGAGVPASVLVVLAAPPVEVRGGPTLGVRGATVGRVGCVSTATGSGPVGKILMGAEDSTGGRSKFGN